MEPFDLNNIRVNQLPQKNIDMNHFEPKFNNNPVITKINKRRTSIINRELLIAAGRSKLAEVKQLIEGDVDVNFVDGDGNTALHYAVESGNLKIVKLLQNKVKDVSIENNDCKTPLDIAKELERNLNLERQDIIEEIGEQIVIDSIKMLEEDPLRGFKRNFDGSIKLYNKSNSDGTKKGATFPQDYTKPVTSEDINNILKLKYIKMRNEKVFEAIQFNQLGKKLDEFLDKQKIYIVYLKDLHWVTLVISKNIACYVDPWKEKIHQDIENELKERNIKVENLIQIQKAENCDSGIFALKHAEKIVNELCRKTPAADIKLEENIDRERERKFFANMLNEKKRTEDKIKSCLKILENLKGDEIQQFTYKNANVFVLFLETFALEDTYPTTMVVDKEKQEKLKRDLQKIKKEYFTEYYFKPKNKQEIPDIRLISDTRSVLLHGIKIVEPEYFSNFVPQNYSPSEFFQDLKKYTKYIHEKLSDENSTPSCKCNDFLRQLPKDTSKGKKEDLENIFFNFVKDVYTQPESINSDMIEKFIFDLTVNIIPLLDYNQERMSLLSCMRNDLIHNFEQYENVENNEKLIYIKSKLPSLRSHLLKYCYSKKVHHTLKSMSPDEDIEDIKNSFQEESTKIQERFAKDHVPTIRTEDAQSFEYMFLESVFPEKDEDIRQLVDQYLKYMVAIDNDEREEENLIGEKEIKTFKQFKELSDIDRREIFEDFIMLKKIRQFKGHQYEEKKRELKRKLECEYGVREGYCDDTVHLYVEGDNKLSKENERKSKEITNVINALKEIKKDCELSNEDIIFLYERFIQEKGIFDLDNLLLSYNLTKSQINLIQVKLQNLNPNPESIGISTKVIRNMLKVFYNSYNKYQIKFDNIKEVFNDKTFLDYLINRDVKQDKNQDTDKEMFQFQDRRTYIFMIIKKLIRIDYTAPYIAGLIIKVQNDKIIEKDDLKTLIEMLLEKDLYLVHLDKLLHIESDKLNLYEEVCNKILEKKDIRVDSMRVIFKESKHVRGILSKLSEKIIQSEDKEKVVKLTKEILKLLNSIAYELHRSGSYDDVLKVLDNEEVTTVQDLLRQEANNQIDVNVLESKFQIARTKNQLGRRSKERSDKEKMYKEALDILKEIYKTISTSCQIREATTRLLILAEIAYTKHLLEHYDDAYEEDKNVLDEVIKFSLNLPDGKINEINSYSEIIDTKKYQNLLTFSDESKKYLDVLNIHSSMAYNKLMKGLKNERLGYKKALSNYEESLNNYEEALNNYEEALEIYKNVYSDRKRYLGLNKDITQTMRNIANLNSKIGTLLLKIKNEKEKSAKLLFNRKKSLTDYQSALLYHQEGLVWDSKIYKSQKEILLSSHPTIVKHKGIIFKELHNVAFTYDKLGTFEESNEEKDLAQKMYDKAIEIYDEVYKDQKKALGENHDETLKTKRRIESIQDKRQNLHAAGCQ